MKRTGRGSSRVARKDDGQFRASCIRFPGNDGGLNAFNVYGKVDLSLASEANNRKCRGSAASGRSQTPRDAVQRETFYEDLEFTTNLHSDRREAYKQYTEPWNKSGLAQLLDCRAKDLNSRRTRGSNAGTVNEPDDSRNGQGWRFLCGLEDHKLCI
jgi:hypothetical protein